MRYTDEDVLAEAEALCPTLSLLRENLKRADEAVGVWDELRLCDLSLHAQAVADTVNELWRGGMRMQEIGALLSPCVRLPNASLSSDLPTVSMAPMRFRANLHRRADEIAFTQRLQQRIDTLGILQDPTTFLSVEEKRLDAALVRNLLSEEAFDVFSQERTELRAVAVASFSEAVELLRRGDVGYCLLPLEERGKRLSTVEELIHRNDLKIVAVTPVFGFDGSAEMTYALVALSFEPVVVEEGDDLYLECTLPKDSTVSLSDVLLVAEGLGITVYRTDEVTYPSEEGRQAMHAFVLRDRTDTVTAFLWYISLFAPELTPVGLYKNLE